MNFINIPQFCTKKNLLTPRRTVLLQKLISFQLVKKSPAFYGTRKFITAFTSARHLSLSWDRSIQPIPPSHFLKIHPNINLPSLPGSPKWSFFLRLPHQNSVYASPLPHFTQTHSTGPQGVETTHRLCWSVISFGMCGASLIIQQV